MSNERKNTPVAVTNLRKIWEQKKHEMEITQIEAAEKLGWTQGAFSQYLNGITQLGPSAVIKIANFLDVDPLAIDPNIGQALPHVKKTIVTYSFRDAETKLNEVQDVNLDVLDNAVRVRMDTSQTLGTFVLPKDTLIECLPWPVSNDYVPRQTTGALFFLVQLIGVKRWKIFQEKDLPKPNTINKQLVIIGFSLY